MRVKENGKQLIIALCAMCGLGILSTGCAPKQQVLQPHGGLPPPFESTPTSEDSSFATPPPKGAEGGSVIAIEEDLPAIEELEKAEAETPVVKPAEKEVEPVEETKPAEKVVLPEPVKKEADKPAEETFVYTVKSGDVLSRIAVTYGTTSKKIMELNGLKNANKIIVGQKLTIPGNGEKVKNVKTPADKEVKSGNKQTTTPKKSGSSKALKPIPADGIHVVVSGDSLSKIASQYKGVTTPGLCEANGLSRNSVLQIGQKIKLVASAKEAEKEANNPGEIVRDPVAPAKEKEKPADVVQPVNARDDVITYPVTSNDTIETICEVFDMTKEEFISVNPNITTDEELLKVKVVNVLIK